MGVAQSDRLKMVRRAVAEECQSLFDKLGSERGLPAELKIKLVATYRETGELAQCEVSLSIPEAIGYDTEGRLTGVINGHHVTVSSEGKRHFRVAIDGKEYLKLPSSMAERELGVEVSRKRSGAQAGYPSEPVGRAVWRHFVNRHNLLDNAVRYTSV